MLTRFMAHIDQHLSFLSGKRLLLACSGGVDSVVLAHLAQAAGLDIDLAHCNFGLRGVESEGDEAFVRQLAQTMGVGIMVRTFDTENHALTHRGSIQMAARELRYQWFDALMDEKGYDHLLTAHQGDDNLETFLINLSRGTGIDGLLGIPEVNGRVVRPLLPFFREDILAYAKGKGLLWREDNSNTDHKYLRNKIRHTVLPPLRGLHPTFPQNFVRTLSNLQGVHALMENHLGEIVERLFEEREGAQWIRISELQALHPRKAYLYGLFQGYGFREAGEVERLLGGMSGKFLLSKGHRLLRDREHLILSPLGKEGPSKEYLIPESGPIAPLPIALEWEEVENMGETGRHILYVDKEKLNFPLLLRKWENGDYFYPFGMQGRKKLAKFFKDGKVDRDNKEKQWLLCSGEDILWVVGRRADQRFGVDGSTRHILKITVPL